MWIPPAKQYSLGYPDSLANGRRSLAVSRFAAATRETASDHPPSVVTHELPRVQQHPQQVFHSSAPIGLLLQIIQRHLPFHCGRETREARQVQLFHRLLRRSLLLHQPRHPATAAAE